MTPNKIILTALREYERRHWEMEDSVWQDKVNKLLTTFEDKVKLEEKWGTELKV